MRAAACQMRSGEDVAANVDEAERLVRDAADGGATLVVLPELFTYLGPLSRVPELAEPLDGPTARRLGEMARERAIWLAAGSLYERDGDLVYNTCPLFAPSGDLVARYRKIHLFDVDLPGQAPFRESTTFAAGDDLVVHATDQARLGLAICYDLRFPELFRGLATLGAEVVTLPAQFQHATGQAHWHPLVRARAIENQCFVVAAAQWGTFGRDQDGRRSFGHSLVVDPWGRVLAEAGEEGSGTTLADLDMTELRRVRTALPALQHRRLGITC